MSDPASVLVIPGQPPTGQPGLTDGLGLYAWGLVAVLAIAAGLWAMRGRRGRSIDPREMAFRRLAQSMNLSRAQVRALRQEAAARGLASPVGLALCPTLAAQAVAERTPARRRSAPVTARLVGSRTG